MRLFGLLCLVLFCTVSLAIGAEDYMIGQGDALEVAVWGIPEMSRSVKVRPDGKITLPAVGDVLATGKTPEELSAFLTEKIKEYVRKPVVTVSVQGILNNRVYITGGGVSRVFDMAKETTLLQLLSQVGDLAQTDLRRAYLSRDGKRVDTDFYALFYEGDLSQDLTLQAEDIIFIPSNQLNKVYVLGAVNQPTNLQFYEGMTVFDAILACGGFNEFAKEKEVTLIHKDKSRKKIDLQQVSKGKDIGANMELQPGDYVIVEESLF